MFILWLKISQLFNVLLSDCNNIKYTQHILDVVFLFHVLMSSTVWSRCAVIMHCIWRLHTGMIVWDKRWSKYNNNINYRKGFPQKFSANLVQPFVRLIIYIYVQGEVKNNMDYRCVRQNCLNFYFVRFLGINKLKCEKKF